MAVVSFFAGKGGVGKTTCAAAYALARAEQGQRVLVVSADPAHSLGDAFGAALGATPRRLSSRRGRLEAVELDAAAALDRWLRPRTAAVRLIADRGTYFDREDVERFLGLSLPGVDELAAMLEVRRLAEANRHDELVIDTAPTGHLLRLLKTPQLIQGVAGVLSSMQEKHRLIEESLGGAGRPDVADALIDELERDGGALEAMLTDKASSAFRWVLLPEAISVAETRDGVAALEHSGIEVRELVVNRLFASAARACGFCDGRLGMQAAAVAQLRERHGRLPVRFLPESVGEPIGAAGLRALGARLVGRQPGAGPSRPRRAARASRASVEGGIAPRRDAGALPATWSTLRLLLFGGKGGVGKSTCAAAAALTLAAADPRRPVRLLCTDPARRIGDVLGMNATEDPRAVSRGPANLTVQQLDADAAYARERERYVRAVDGLFDDLRGGSKLDATYDRAILGNLIDLAPPGLDEIFATLAVLDALEQKGRALVVVDTAPTGHALRLLEMPALALQWVQALMRIALKYQQLVGLGELATDLLSLSRRLRALSELLTDPSATRFVVVARAEALPRKETLRLLKRLDALGVPAGELLINAFTAGECGACVDRATRERREAKRLVQAAGRLRGHPCPAIFAPAVMPPPSGAAALRRFARTWTLL